MGEDLRQRYAEALIGRIKQSIIVSDPGVVGQPFAATEYDLADAVMAVRDEELERLRHTSNTDSRITLQLREEITRLRINAEKDVCSGCMQREEARDRAMESARQTGVKYEGAKQRWYEQQDRAEDAERERDEWRERAETSEAAIARVRSRAGEMAELAEQGDDSAGWLDRAIADSGRGILAALDDTKEAEHG